MRAKAIGELLDLTPQAAVAHRFDAGNYRILRWLLLLFRFDAPEYLAVAGVDAAAMGWALLQPGMPEPGGRIGMAVGSLAVTGIVLAIAIRVSRRRRESFLALWRHEVARERDSRRMRSELQDAREVQLSMLPEGEPELAWGEVSSVSLPVSEVGGDYFDFFELPDSRLAIVIADVAGHGMASGLVMSAVRGGLHLLRERLTEPAEVLRDLDRMLRDTVSGRIFVTLQIALLDPVGGRLTVANAGHPQLVLLTRDGRALRLGPSGLPLGTRLEGEPAEQSAALGDGDLLLLFSDGVPELRHPDGEALGEERLLAELLRMPADAGAERVRDSLLERLEAFQGDGRRQDDLTLVVVRVGSPGT